MARTLDMIVHDAGLDGWSLDQWQAICARLATLKQYGDPVAVLEDALREELGLAYEGPVTPTPDVIGWG